MLDRVKIVLVGTSHAGNIGSAARAMKVMGLSNLVLVDPQCERDGQTTALAAGASDVAMNAQVVDTVEQAVADCSLVIGTSARSRTLDWPMVEPRECGEKLVEALSLEQSGSVAVVFGRERTGLTNEELQKCQYHLTIPANPEYSSLNLAMAVQTVSYEIRMAYLAMEQSQYEPSPQEAYPRYEQLEQFYSHLEKVLYDTHFIERDKPQKVMDKLRRLFTRARPESQELNILRGVLTAIEKAKNFK
ncbi:tRNA (cytosine(32)/uridine(32)-2'-O)-methyltransferase TrmJ [Vibrio agarivorans]|uniref:tRNA (cytosine(32)/uridine(32)-2'-O)-methyltransferase TrmJ n=1 Tax=Vibrio agarivorans TaxID=153622 RepID=UPI00222F89B4|nr:tRNA (cytosine(32)/uridine(32)-2'-O)-methyltransferase TrmJ [Vibrio agarivorans]MDN3661491.1 tRNA (cytosine(32)/uridine(32)-2'-O)-methyltransferase TrmJ [Vibrio agarivorans]